MSKKILEGELIESKAKVNSYNSYDSINNYQIKNFPGWRLLFCLVPIIGLVFSIVWFYMYKKSQRIEIVFPVMGIILGLFSTTTFIILRFILKSIF